MTWYFPRLAVFVPKFVGEAIYPIDKTNLDVLRILHFLSLAVITVWFVPRDWPALKSRCSGRRSCAGSIRWKLSVSACSWRSPRHFVFTEVSNACSHRSSSALSASSSWWAWRRWFRGINAWNDKDRDRVRLRSSRATRGATHDGARCCFAGIAGAGRRRLGPSIRPNAAWPSNSSSAISRCRKSPARSPPSGSTSWWSAPALRYCPGRTASRMPIRRGCKSRSLEKLPGVAVKVTTDVKARRTAAEMVKTLAAGFSRRQAGADGLADRNRGRHAGD